MPTLVVAAATALPSAGEQLLAAPMTPAATPELAAPSSKTDGQEVLSGIGYLKPASRLSEPLRWARPRSSGRKAWDINLGGPGYTWERVTSPDDKEIVFRFQGQPDERQMELISKYGFAYDGSVKEASRPNDATGRMYADKLAWYLREFQRKQGQARTVRS